jgi:hypothetical protein
LKGTDILAYLAYSSQTKNTNKLEHCLLQAFPIWSKICR